MRCINGLNAREQKNKSDCARNQSDYRICNRAFLETNIDSLGYLQMEYRELVLPQLWQLTVAPNAVSAPG